MRRILASMVVPIGGSFEYERKLLHAQRTQKNAARASLSLEALA
jgi:hypothetical protein